MTKRVWIIPVVIALLTISGVLGARVITVPTLAFTYDEVYTGAAERATFTVSGVHCYGTADYLREHIQSVPGLVSFVAYAGKRRVVVDYDRTRTSAEDIVRAIEAPAMTRTGPRSLYEVLSWKVR
ncbi:MAG: heavy-metal-associated domain-containing protein [Candidatus Eisenbacteria bacterium]